MWAPPAQADLDLCLRQATPPTAAAGKVVLARPLSDVASGPNIVVIPMGSSRPPANCNPQSVIGGPRTISVGAGAALVFDGPGFPDRGIPSWRSPWGAVDVGPNDPAPNIDAGAPEPWTPTKAFVVPAQQSLTEYQSCRDCDLQGVSYNTAQSIYSVDFESFVRDVSGANLTGAYLGAAGNPPGQILDDWNFDKANLTRASLAGASVTDSTFNDAIVSGTHFDVATLSGVTFSDLRYTTPPNFARVQLGNGGSGGGVACTAFKDTSLLGATFTLSQAPDPACASSPLFPGSTVPASFVGSLAGHPADLAQTQYVSDGGHALAGADLRGIDLDGSGFVGTPVDLENAHLDGASLVGTNFRLADLSGATLTGVTAPRAVFADADLSGATFAAGSAGGSTVLRGANFVRANLSGTSFQSANISDAAFDAALALQGGPHNVGTDFNSVLATGAIFSGAHIYGDGQAFEQARDLSGADFSNAILAGSGAGGAGFDFTNVNLTGAKFDRTQCVSCNFAGSTMTDAVFSNAYLPGVEFAGAQSFGGVDLAGAWLYCGDPEDSQCEQNSDPDKLAWPLALGVGETYGPVPFASTSLKGVSLQDVTACPDGLPPSPPASAPKAPATCAGHLLPSSGASPARGLLGGGTP